MCAATVQGALRAWSATKKREIDRQGQRQLDALIDALHWESKVTQIGDAESKGGDRDRGHVQLRALLRCAGHGWHRNHSMGPLQPWRDALVLEHELSDCSKNLWLMSIFGMAKQLRCRTVIKSSSEECVVRGRIAFAEAGF